MDVFKINWNQKMKTDMFVNKMLNDDRTQLQQKYQKWSYNWVKGESIPGKIKVGPINDRWYRKYEWLNEDTYDVFDDKRNFYYKLIDEPFMGQKRSLTANTRPNSLYNLHYASIRK